MAGHLVTAGIPAAIYHGSLPRADKERAIATFRDDAPVLLSTESAGEGVTLEAPLRDGEHGPAGAV